MDWVRLEGGQLDPNMTEGMASAIADPLWLLARQWQVGEFRGEDAASPVMIDAAIASAPVTKYWIDSAHGRWSVKRADAGWPLETHVEHEAIADGPAGARVRLDAGAALARELRQAGVGVVALDAVRVAFAFDATADDALDPVGTAQLGLLARRVPDGAAVASAIGRAGGDPAAVPELAVLGAAALAVIANWYAHQPDRFCDVAADERSAWDASRLEYRFGVSAELASGQVDLAAPEYPGGTLDWYHFDVDSSTSKARTPTARPAGGRVAVEKRLTSLPAPLRFAGMPASRWWEFEDRDVDFGDMAGGPEDLARSVLAAFAMVAGDDWLAVPCDLPAGTVSRVQRVRVLDDFGDTTTIRSTAALDAARPSPRVWRFFELDGDPGPAQGHAPLLFLPPVVHAAEQSNPIEQVEFRRDEMANLAWAIERRVESPAGRTVDRNARRTPPDVTTDTDPNPDAWRYQLATDVPDHWLPLVPVRINGSRPQIALRRGRLAVDGRAPRALGRILEPERSFVVHEEEIPSGGTRVERRWQLARGADGAVRLWVGRRKSPGGGPMQRTPLRFDNLTGYRNRPTR